MAEKKQNSGGGNTGDRNTGGCNSGDYNSGYWNSGDYNSRNMNSGSRNTGNYNSGNMNSGDRNTGYWNSGNFNSGHFNSGHYNAGFFCTGIPKSMFFDNPTDLSWSEAARRVPYVNLKIYPEWVPSEEMTPEEKATNSSHTEAGGYLRPPRFKTIKEAFTHAWNSGQISDADKARFKALPNFDAEKFYAITGVDVREEAKADDSCAGRVVMIEGRKYRLEPVEEDKA